MTITESISDRSSQTDIIGSRQGLSLATADDSPCRVQISNVVCDIESPDVREIVGVVFADLLRLLAGAELDWNPLAVAV